MTRSAGVSVLTSTIDSTAIDSSDGSWSFCTLGEGCWSAVIRTQPNAGRGCSLPEGWGIWGPQEIGASSAVRNTSLLAWCSWAGHERQQPRARVTFPAAAGPAQVRPVCEGTASTTAGHADIPVGKYRDHRPLCTPGASAVMERTRDGLASIQEAMWHSRRPAWRQIA